MLNTDPHTGPSAPTPDDTTLALVLGDFGRDAAIRFCASLADAERAFIQQALPAGAPFYDEYRRLTLALVGDLPYVKHPWLDLYIREGKPLDEAILVGFPGGPTPRQVQARLGALALEAMRGPVERGCRRVLVLLPCNTLAPVSWGLSDSFASADSVRQMLDDANWPTDPSTPALIERLATLELSFPTVPEAVIRRARRDGGTHLLPMGTEEIEATYRQALARLQSPLSLAAMPGNGQGQVLDAIQAAIAGDADARRAARAALVALCDRSRETFGPGLVPVEACTDLHYEVGLDSNATYAQEVVRTVYSRE